MFDLLYIIIYCTSFEGGTEYALIVLYYSPHTQTLTDIKTFQNKKLKAV